MSEYLYVDSSAFAKRWLRETGAATFAEAAEGRVLSASRLTLAETGRAIAIQLNDVDEQTARLEDLDRTWRTVVVVPFSDEVARRAIRLALNHGLRSSDAIHLASALTMRVSMRFATWDKRLWNAARATGLRTVPVSEPA